MRASPAELLPIRPGADFVSPRAPSVAGGGDHPSSQRLFHVNDGKSDTDPPSVAAQSALQSCKIHARQPSSRLWAPASSAGEVRSPSHAFPWAIDQVSRWCGALRGNMAEQGCGGGGGHPAASMALEFRSMGMPELWRQGAELFRVGEVAVDVLARVFSHLDSFKDMANARRVCKNWGEGVTQTLASRDSLNFAGWRVTDDAVATLVSDAWCLRELDLWGCRITNAALQRISLAPCCASLTSISLWGVVDITDEGVVQLISRAKSLQHLNAGGTHITDVSVKAMATHCPQLRVLNLWGCRNVTEAGLIALSKGCPLLYSMNVWGMNIAPTTELKLLGLNPQLKLKLKPSQIRFNFPVDIS